MALSIEFGIAWTYALGACFYVVCAVMIGASRLTSRIGVSGPVQREALPLPIEPHRRPN